MKAAAGRQRSSGAKAWEYRRRLNEPRELGLGRADERLGDSHRRFENGWPSVAFPSREVSEIRGRNIRQTRSTGRLTRSLPRESFKTGEKRARKQR